ncbi:MAG: NAD-dependent epimerase/dehydratase family protein [Ardenticatenaceae bacterium]|nr:NAD-dependent epimerase/dehydratase family protein [Ardenticatenaceae bacterium]
MKVFVTGGAGFIGSHVTHALIGQGHSVTVFDNLSTGTYENLTGLPIQFIEGDLADFDAVARAVQGCEVVFHEAAMVSVPRSIAEPILNHQSNVTGTFHLFEAARRAGVRRVVYASSAAVYGDEPTLPKHEASVIAPLSPYGAAKYIAEVYATAYATAYGDRTQFVGLRYMNVFGPRQDPSSPYSGVLSIFCQAVLNGRPCRIFGDGEQTRDFVYVADVVHANLLAATVPLPDKSAVFNIGRGEQTSLNQIVAILGELVPQSVNVVYESERHGDIRHSVANISLARTCLGYMPRVSIRDGLRATLDWFRGTGSGS